MIKHNLIFVLLLAGTVYSQTSYPSPPSDLIPEKLKNIPQSIKAYNFPKENDPIKINDNYYWKHTTSLVSTTSDISIIEYGAYLYYNNKWNLRKIYPLKSFDKNFKTKEELLKLGQPYVWNSNWRVGKELFGGWALWYFIGIDEDGTKVCGYATINTTDNLLKN